MEPVSTFESVILGIGSFVCLFIASLVLGFKKENRTPHVFFALFLFLISVI